MRDTDSMTDRQFSDYCQTLPPNEAARLGRERAERRGRDYANAEEVVRSDVPSMPSASGEPSIDKTNGFYCDNCQIISLDVIPDTVNDAAPFRADACQSCCTHDDGKRCVVSYTVRS